MSKIILGAAIAVQTKIAELRSRDEGQTMAEYALILAGIAILVLLMVVFLGGEIRELFGETGSSVESAPVSG